ncbi:MAG: alpha/beta hydrolase [Solobacterium sp.]|nr:alpha/beta hydrolase [Solobacterium sp.]
MIFNAENLTVCLQNDSMECVTFGLGTKPLVIIPGLSDGMATVKGMALPFALMYHYLSLRYKVYIFSRPNHLSAQDPSLVTTRHMAQDLSEAMDRLAINDVYVVGISMGGMIVQWLAIDHPEKVNRLALVVTAAKPNEMMREVVSNWIGLAEEGKIKELMLDTAEKTYTGNNITAKLSAGLIQLKDKERFCREAKACLQHDAWEMLDQITCPTLIIGGRKDATVGVEASLSIKEKISDSQLYIYEKYGHGLYEEAKNFWRRIAEFSGDKKSLIKLRGKTYPGWILETDLGVAKTFEERDLKNILDAITYGSRDFMVLVKDDNYMQISMKDEETIHMEIRMNDTVMQWESADTEEIFQRITECLEDRTARKEA